MASPCDAIHTGVRGEIPGSDPQKIRGYLEGYLPFHAQFDGINYRLVDKALWAFGKFLSENGSAPVVFGLTCYDLKQMK